MPTTFSAMSRRTSIFVTTATKCSTTSSGWRTTMIPFDSRPCRIVHGPNDSYLPNLEGKSIASVRRCMATVFSISTDAEAFIGGSVVAPEYKLRAGDSVEFLKRGWGRKGAGNPWGRDSLRSDPDDFYPTPDFATRALLQRENLGTTIWEPACGNGAIS